MSLLATHLRFFHIPLYAKSVLDLNREMQIFCLRLIQWKPPNFITDNVIVDNVIVDNVIVENVIVDNVITENDVTENIITKNSII